MKPMEKRNEVSTNAVGEAVAMGIDASALAHVMSILSGIYEDPELAVLREYATNATDAHVAAGNGDPIEIELPTELRPSLIIRDHGIGLSADDIRTIYSQYGASTKRDTNDAVGMLGIGCKSALAYTSQFTVAGCKDGERTVVSITINEAGAGEVLILAQEPTDNPNGVTVTVPIDDPAALREKAEMLFGYWEPGTVLVNGEEPKRHADHEDALQLDGGFTLLPREYGEPGLTVVMGGVPYPELGSWQSKYVEYVRAGGFRVIANVEIGRVQFAPSRETLLDHPTTRAALDGLASELERAVSAYAAKEIEAAPDKTSAAYAYLRLKRALGPAAPDGATWQGRAIPLRVKSEGHRMWAGERKSYRPIAAAEEVRPSGPGVSFDVAGRATWVLGYDNAKWTKAQRTKLLAYLEKHEGDEQARERDYIIYAGATVPLADWLGSNVRTVAWSNVRSWRDPDTAGPRKAAKRAAYDGRYPTTRGTLSATDLLVSREPIYYYVGREDSWCSGRSHMCYLGKGILVFLSAGRRDKFLRLVPSAKEVNDAVYKKARGIWNSFSDADRRTFWVYQSLSGADKRALNLLSRAEVELPNPELRRAVAASSEDGTIERMSYACERLHRHGRLGLSETEEVKNGAKGAAALATALDRYPLLNALDRYSLIDFEHLGLYIKAVNAANETKEDA